MLGIALEEFHSLLEGGNARYQIVLSDLATLRDSRRAAGEENCGRLISHVNRLLHPLIDVKIYLRVCGNERF